MSVLLGIVAPIFGIMILGHLAVRIGGLGDGAVQGLVIYVFNFAIPVLLFRSLATTQIPPDIQWGFLLSYYGGAITVYALGFASGRWVFRRPLADQAMFGMGASFSNTVLMGIPILLTAYGTEATLPALLIIAFHGPFLMSLTAGIVQVARVGEVSLAQQARGVLLDVVRNPIIMGLLLGIAMNLSGLAIPGPLDRMAEMLGASAVPCALFALGASLAGYPLVGDVPPALLLSTFKLVVHPLLVWVLAVPVLGLHGIWVPVAVTMAAMPSGVNVYLFGARYDAAAGVTARTVLVSTVISVATLSGLLFLFHGT